VAVVSLVLEIFERVHLCCDCEIMAQN